MFSVGDWAISAPLKTQTQPAKSDVLQSKGGITVEAGNHSNKRKREKRNHKDERSLPKGINVEAARKKAEKQQESEHFVEDDAQREDTVDLANSPELRKTEKRTASDGKASSDLNGSSSLVQPEKDIDPAGSEEPSSKKRKRAKRGKSEHGKEGDAIQTLDRDRSDKGPHSLPSKPFNGAATSSAARILQVPGTTSKLTPLQASMRAKLASARFRHLNETLYTSPSSSAFDLFSKNPGIFDEYHHGFRRQVEAWPENPVDGYLADIRKRGGTSREVKSLPRTKGVCKIADLGCGDAHLASSLRKEESKLNVKILSYDLSSPSPLVTKADIADLPLESGSINVAVFCLALMGTNWTDFIDEAYRVLHWRGEMWVAEIKSRFGHVEGKKKVVEHSVGHQQKKKKPRSRMSDGEKAREELVKKDEDQQLALEVDGVPSTIDRQFGDETDVSAFIKVLATRGLVLDGEEKDAVDRRNKMFVKLRFLKAAQPIKGKNVEKAKEAGAWKSKGKRFTGSRDDDQDLDEKTVLKPCVYKLR